MSLVRILYDLRPLMVRAPLQRHFERFGFGFSPAELQEFFNFPQFKYAPRIATGEFGATTLDKDGFKVSLDMKDFKPNEISVKTMNNAVVVEGKSEVRDDGDDAGVISREFIRKYVLPKDYDPEKVESTLTSDGILTIVAPGPPVNERVVQIKHVEKKGEKGGE